MIISPVSINNYKYKPKTNNLKSQPTKINNEPRFSGGKLSSCWLNFIRKAKNEKQDQSIFFIDMDYYQRNKSWAEKMLLLSHEAAKQIKQKDSFDLVLKTITDNISKINHSDLYGKYRHSPNGFCILEKQPNRGIEYFSRYKHVMELNHTNYIKPKSNKEYPKANTCEIYLFNLDGDSEAIQVDYGIYTSLSNKPLYGKCSNLELAKKEYDKLIQIDKPSLAQINKSCATINWLIAQESPFINGSDSIARLLTTAIYNAYNVKLSPPKKGISFDFEAFYSDLDDYIKKYPNLFSQKLYRTV